MHSTFTNLSTSSRDDLLTVHADLLGTLCQVRFEACTYQFYGIVTDANTSAADKAALIRGMCKLRIKVWVCSGG